MLVTKRDGSTETVLFDKISARIRRLSSGGGKKLGTVDVTRVTTMVVAGMFDGISTSQIDELAADACASLTTEHPEYGTLASRLVVSNMHKNTSENVLDTYERLESVLSNRFMEVVREHTQELQSMIDYRRDYDFDFFAIKTLQTIYCAKVDGLPVERPQHVYLRVAIALHEDDMKRVRETYALLSKHKFTHASPTLFNAGFAVQQLASCFLTQVDDSLDSITGAWKEIANISKLGGGIGTHVHAVRSKGAPIRTTNGTSDGLIPMLRVMNDIVSYVNQSGKRKGSMAVYLSPHHPDAADFLDLRRPGGDESMRCRDLFLAMWIPDLFMRRVEAGEPWSFFDPLAAPGLDDVHGAEYDALYRRYESEGRAKSTVRAREVWAAILRSQIETGTPYLLYKDACNAKSNQQNLGTIKCSNLCVAPDTRVLVRGPGTRGSRQERIDHLVDSTVEAWNGVEWSEVTIRKTSDASPLLTVVVRDLDKCHIHSFDCTPYHRFYLKRSRIASILRPGARKVTTAADLKPGDRLEEWTPPQATSERQGRTAPGRRRHRVLAVYDKHRVDATYCFTEPKRASGVFNGILTGNCSEIVEYTSEEETSVCTLASVSLPSFVKNESFDFAELARVTKVVARNLDKVIDKNVYPVDKARVSNFKHRPVGIGVQGLADVFAMLRMPFDSSQAAALNEKIFATMYHAALDASADLAAECGPYSTYEGSPASRGLLQYDLWNVEPHPDLDWAALKNKIRRHGLRNSLSIAVMPTASTAQVLGNNESIEPFTSLIYTRRTMAGEYVLVNRYLVDDLMKLDLWNPETKDRIIEAGGSVQNIQEIPEDVRDLYKTAWDLSMRTMIDHSADRGPYVCQSQSLNLFVAEPTHEKLSSMHFYAWRKGLKTGQYYLRSKPAVHAKKITLSTISSTDCLMCSA